MTFHPFFIGKTEVSAPFILAPMDGISDSPFREITRSLGSALSYTEFINGIDVVHNAPCVNKRCQFSEKERPVVFQLFDDSPERIIESARILESRKPDVFDVNMGCSVHRVSNRGAGAGLLRHPEKVRAIVEGLVKTVSVPVTVKIRLGWDDQHINYLEIAKIAEDCGASAVALHGRTRDQLFSGAANWDAVGMLKSSLSIPVIGNGDLQTPAEAEKRMAETNCDAVMIGRAAIKNPWFFAGFDLETVPPALFQETVFRHLHLMIAHYGPENGCRIFRKYAKSYLLHIRTSENIIHEIITENDPCCFVDQFHDAVKKGVSRFGISTNN